jgi:hypothetical protein
MEIKPFPHNLALALAEKEIERVEISFSANGDEAYVDIGLYTDDGRLWGMVHHKNVDLRRVLLEWVADAYEYSGDGEGYGDVVTYDFLNNTVTHVYWYDEREEGESSKHELVVVDPKKKKGKRRK